MRPNRKENPFWPEDPKDPQDNFEVVVDNSETFFTRALEDFKNHRNVRFALSDASLDGLFFEVESSFLNFLENEGLPTQMMVGTSLYLSRKGVEIARGGLFTLDEVQGIQTELESRNLISTIVESDEYHYLLILLNGFELQVAFRHKRSELNQYETVSLQMLEIEDVGKPVRRSFDTLPTFARVRDQRHFSQMIEAYALLYTHLVNSIYAYAGVEMKPTRISLCNTEITGTDLFEIPDIPEKSQETEDTLRINVPDNPERERRRLTFDDIAGQPEAVALAMEFVDYINNREYYQQYGDVNTKGIMLAGPPGVGKTLLAQIIADQADAELISVTVKDIYNRESKWYGQPEANLIDAFDKANLATEQGRSAIILFNEFDSMFSARDTHEVEQRVAQIFLTHTGDEASNPNVYIIATTNRLEDIDEAFIRSGRIDAIVEMSEPKTAEQRKQILEICIRRREGENKSGQSLFAPDLDLDKIAKLTTGMSGADLDKLIKTASRDKTRVGKAENKREPVTNVDLEKALLSIKPAKQKRPMGFNTQRL